MRLDQPQAVGVSAGIFGKVGFPRGAVVAVLGWTVHRRLLLLERWVDAGVRASAVVAGFRIEQLCPEEADEYVAGRLREGSEGWPRTQGWHGGGAELVRARLSAGEQCSVVRIAGEIAASCWAVRKEAWLGYLGCRLDAGEDGVYVFDVHTRPKHRNQGMARALISGLAEVHGNAGMRRLVAAVLPENEASLRCMAAAGFRIVGRVSASGLGPWRRHACDAPEIRVR